VLSLFRALRQIPTVFLPAREAQRDIEKSYRLEVNCSGSPGERDASATLVKTVMDFC